MPTLPFQIVTGPVEAGSCDFTVRLGESSWSCRASYIASLPVTELIHSAIDLYEHLFVEPLPMENAIWDSLAADEPGGIVIRATPEESKVKVVIFHYPSEPMWPKPDELPEIPPVSSGLMDYWTYADAIYEDAARVIARHGFTGLREAWEFGSWGIDGHWTVFSIEHFLYLAALIKHRSPRRNLTLEDELDLLREILEKSKEETGH
jgi:hypothetical protein